jgi:hypothetical protein
MEYIDDIERATRELQEDETSMMSQKQKEGHAAGVKIGGVGGNPFAMKPQKPLRALHGAQIREAQNMKQFIPNFPLARARRVMGGEFDR